jgi:GNAT superfamily N-acetyltransferase
MQRLTVLHSILRELRRRLLRDGVRGTLAFLSSGVRAQLVKRESMLVLRKQLDEIAVPARRGRVRLEPIESRHLPPLRELNRERGDLEGDARFAADLGAGYAGYAAYRGEQLVGCYWWAGGATAPHPDLRRFGLGIEMGPADVYGYDFYVDKRQRAGGTANEVLHLVETALRERGFERLWGWVASENRMALWTYDARGYRPAWTVERTRVLRRWRNRVVPINAQPAERKQVPV